MNCLKKFGDDAEEDCERNESGCFCRRTAIPRVLIITIILLAKKENENINAIEQFSQYWLV